MWLYPGIPVLTPMIRRLKPVADTVSAPWKTPKDAECTSQRATLQYDLYKAKTQTQSCMKSKTSPPRMSPQDSQDSPMLPFAQPTE